VRRKPLRDHEAPIEADIIRCAGKRLNFPKSQQFKQLMLRRHTIIDATDLEGPSLLNTRGQAL
jgi:hypothetical protein